MQDSSPIPRILIAGTGRKVGKSFVTLGLVHELRKRGFSVSCAVVGPSLLQAVILRRISGRYVHMLDDRILGPSELAHAVMRAGLGADILLIDGSGALYDGEAAGSLRGADAHVAELTQSKVVLVIDACNALNSAAAIAKGFRQLQRGFEIPGVILNCVDERFVSDNEYYPAVFQAFGEKGLLGVIPNKALSGELPRANISQDKNTVSLARQFIIECAKLVERSVDIDALVKVAKSSAHLNATGLMSNPGTSRARIAVSDDSCFHLGVQDNLELLRQSGAELVSFSPLADTHLPKRIGAVYLCGAYLSEYGQSLAENTSMSDALRDFANKGGVIFAEGAGCAYLCREIRVNDQVLAGVGLINAVATYQAADLRYIEAVTIEDSILGRPGMIVKGIDSNEWKIDSRNDTLQVLRVSTDGAPSCMQGYSPSAQIVATPSFFHFGSNPEMARNIVETAAVSIKR